MSLRKSPTLTPAPLAKLETGNSKLETCTRARPLVVGCADLQIVGAGDVPAPGCAWMKGKTRTARGKADECAAHGGSLAPPPGLAGVPAECSPGRSGPFGACAPDAGNVSLPALAADSRSRHPGGAGGGSEFSTRPNLGQKKPHAGEIIFCTNEAGMLLKIKEAIRMSPAMLLKTGMLPLVTHDVDENKGGYSKIWG